LLGKADKDTGEGVYQLLEQMNREKGITLIIVTHNEEIASRQPKRFRLVAGGVV